MNANVCANCGKQFSTPGNLRRHFQTCKAIQNSKRDGTYRIQREEHERELRELREEHERELRELREQRIRYELQIQQQEHTIASQSKHIDLLASQIFEIAKQPKNHHHINTMNNKTNITIINQLAPYDLETTKIEAILAEHFTPEVFEGGPRAIARLVAEVILTDPETKKPRIVCTDQERRNFKYIDSDTGELVVDPGFQKTHDLLKKPLVNASWDLWEQHFERSRSLQDRTLDNAKFITNARQLSGSLLPYLNSKTIGIAEDNNE